MNAIKTMLPYWAITAVGFYVLPFAMQDTGAAMLILLLATPLICFACALVYGIKHGFNIVFPIVVALLFIPAIFIFYNKTAWVYAVIYFVIPLVGNFVGRSVSKQGK